MRSVAPLVGLNVRVLRRQPFQRCQVLQTWVDDVNRHAESFGYLLDGDVGHAHQFALLDAPDVLAGQSCTVGELLLADTLLFAQGSDTLPHALCCLFLVHSSLSFILFLIHATESNLAFSSARFLISEYATEISMGTFIVYSLLKVLAAMAQTL